MKANLQERTRQEYQKRINNVINFMQHNLEKKLGVNELAAVANFSAYHFQHIFKAFTGHSLKSYLNRLRLNSAAYKLLYRPDLSVTDISMEYDFSCTSDFIRAFKKQFKRSPLQFRQMKKDLVREIDIKANFINLKKVDKKVRLQKMEALKLAYIQCQGLAKNRKNGSILSAYKRLFSWAGYKDYLSAQTQVIGVYADNPEFTPLAECRFYACLSVPEQVEPEGEVGICDWSLAGKYAVFRFNPHALFFISRFFNTVLYLYKRWLPDHGYIPDDKPMFELYQIKNNRVKYLDFCIPVKRLK